MSRPISAMADDLAKAMSGHLDSVRSALDGAAQRMARETAAMSAPTHGVSITSKVTPAPNGPRVDVSVRGVTGFGTVHGGTRAAGRAVAERMDAVARGAGLDRRR